MKRMVVALQLTLGGTLLFNIRGGGHLAVPAGEKSQATFWRLKEDYPFIRRMARKEEDYGIV